MEKVVGILETQKPGEAEAFEILLNYASENNFSFALWRSPNDPVKHLIISYTAKTLEPKAIIEDLAPGFIFAPFDKTKSRYYLPADMMFTFSNGMLNEPAHDEATASREWFNEAASRQD
ncbi:MAG TPA: hypothetical protein PKX51_14235 [Cyclobacteriaceae bacterium]|nr:hypothetical protein [Cyclobacteriaceae bacterium]